MRRLAWSEVLSLRLLGVAVSAMAATAVPSHSQTVRYDYDAAGRLNLARSAAGEVQYSYDEAANLLQVTVPSAGPLAIAALSPLGGAPGTLVTISGSGFSTEPGANLVEFNGIGAEVVSASPSSLVVRVPSGAGIGDVSVTVAGRVAWSGVAFDASGAGGGRPVLTSISPTVAAVGATVVVSGMNLMVGGAMPEVTVNGIVAAVSAASNTSLTFTVPLGATTGSVVVRTGNGASAATTVLYLQVDSEGMVTATATVLVGGPAANVTVKAERSAVVHFSATAGEALQVRFSGMGPFSPSATVYGPNGEIVVNCGFLHTASATCALPAIARSGGHQVVLRANRDGVASVAVVNTALAAGASVTVAPGEVKRIEFDGVAGQDIGVGVAALATTPTGQPVRVRILAPGGQVLRDCGAALAAGLVCAPPRLPSSGRYSVELSPSPGVSATLALSWSAARSIGSLAALSPAGGSVLTHQPARPGEPGSVLLDVLPQGVTARVVGRAAIRLFSPGGALLADLSSAATASATSITSLSIPGSTAGQHTLLVFPLDVATGQVQVSLRRNVGGTIMVDGPPVNVSRPATFGVELSFVATATSAGLGVSTAAGASTAFVTATLAPQSVRYFGSCTGSAPGVSCGLLGLVPGQTYLINVSAASNESAGAELAFTLSSDVSARLTVNGGWQPISLQRIGQRARLSFRARAGGNYRVEWRNANFAANGGAFAAPSQVQLYAPNGQSVGPFNWINMTFPTAGYNFSGLPQDGLYDIFVGPHATSTGTAEFRVTGDFVPEPGGDESGEIPLLPPWAMAVLAALLLGSIAHRSRAPTVGRGALAMSFVLRACFALLCAVTFPLAWAAVELIDSDPPARAEDVGVQASFELHLRELPAGAQGIATALFLGPRGAEEGRIAAPSAGRLRVTPHRPLLPGADYTLLVAPRGGGAPPWAAVAFRTRALPAPAPAEESAPPDAGSEGEFFRPGPEQRRGLWLSGAVHAHSRDAQQQARELSSILARVPSESARSALRTSLLRAGHPGASALSQLSPTAPADAARGTAKPSAQAASAAGVSLAGQVLRLDGRPLPGVAVSMGGRSAQTDAEGEFMLTGLAPGAQVLVIDGRRAGERRADHGRYEYALELRAGANELPHTVWLTRIDRRHAVRLPSPTIEEAVVTHPDMPGFELRIPPGTVIRDAEGQIVREVSVTPIPVDQKPFPFPYAGVPLYYTIQPGGARLESVDGQPRGATLHYPNYSTQPAGALVELFDYDPQGRGWYVYAKGRVSADGTTIDPARPFTLYQFGMSSLASGGPPTPPGPPPPPCPGCWPKPPTPSPCDGSGDPVFCASGQFLEFGTDLFLADLNDLILRREHITGSTNQAAFGVGGRSTFDLYLHFRDLAIGTNGQTASAIDLVLPAGGYVRMPAPDGAPARLLDPAAVFRSNEPGGFFGATASITQALINSDFAVRTTAGDRYGFGYNGAHLMWIEDRWGNRTSLLRDATYRVTRVISPSGRWIEFTYGVAGCTPCIATATDHTGRRVQYSYDALGRLEHVTDPTGERVSYTYDSEHRMLTVTDARRNRKVLNEYHTGTGNTLLDGRVRHQTYADGSTHGFGYSFGEGPDGVVRITRSEVTDARGFVRRRVYDSRQRITADTLALGQPEQATTTYGYDSAGLMTAQTDPLLRRTAYSYDTAGNLTSRTVLDGTAQQAAWATAHEPQCNQPRLSTDPLSRKITATYTGCVLDQVADDLGHRVRYQWNPNGTLRRLIREPSPGVSLATHYEYNESGDLVRITDALERSTRLEVDALGRTTAVVDPAGNRSTFAYDAKDRLVQRCNALVQCATYGYDANDNLTSFVMGTTRRQWTYDAMNRLIAEQRDGVTLLTWSYDGTGLLRTVTDASGRQLEHVSHDALGRVKQSRLSQGGTVRRTVDYGYDLAGRLLTLADSAAGTLSYTHDDRFDAIASETTPAGSVQYAYFANGLRQAMTASGASTVSYEYDAANRLVGIGQAAGAGPAQPLTAQAVSFGYDGANRRTALNLPNGIVVASAWDEADQIQRLSYRRGGAALGELAYGHDAAGRRVKVEGSFARTLLPGAASLATGEDGRVASDNGAAATYDAMGRLTQDAQYRYVWDEAGQLIEVRNAGNNALRASFSYDAAGRRSSKSIDGQVTRYMHDGINPIQLQDGSGTPQENLLAAGVDQWLLRTRAGQTQYFLADAPFAFLPIVALLHPVFGDVVALALIPVVVASGIGLMGLSCPHCHTSLLYREESLFGVKTRAFWPSLPKICPKCGKPTR